MPKFNKTSPLPIKTILDEKGFLDNKKMLSVPIFQRNYDWRSVSRGKTPAQVQVLLDDLLDKWHEMSLTSNPETGEYLLGPMVIIDEAKNQTKVELLDGQQRLATITMILCAARDIILELYTNATCDSENIDSAIITGWSDICKMIERRKTDLASGREVHDNWKFELNKADRKFFKEFIQEYEAEHPTGGPDKFCETQNDKCKRLELKLKEIREILSKKKEERIKRTGEVYTDSEIFLMEAYEKICEYLRELLITGFQRGVEAEDQREEIETKAKEWLEQDMRSVPRQYDFEEDFFSDELNGLDALQRNVWSEENKASLDQEFNAWQNNSRKAEVLERRAKMTFNDWINEKIKNKKKKISTREKYDVIYERELRKKVNADVKSERLRNVSTLLSFCKIGIGDCLFSVRVMVKEDADAFQIFETLNSTGQPLSKNSLVKNWVLKKISEQEQDEWNDNWEKVFTEKLAGLKTSNMADDFIRESLRSRPVNDPNGGKIFDSYEVPGFATRVSGTKNLLYQIIKSQISSSNSDPEKCKEEEEKKAKEYVDSLLEDVTWYLALENPLKYYPDDLPAEQASHRDSKAAIMDLHTLGATHIRLPILAARRKWEEDSVSYQLLVKFLVPFFFRYKTIEQNHNAKLETWMLKICKIIEDEEEVRALRLIIKIILQLDDSQKFENEFLKVMDSAGDNYKKYALHKITEHLDSAYQDTDPKGKLELEHIFPKNPEFNDNGTTTKNWDLDEFFAEIDKINDISISPVDTEFNVVRDEIGSTSNYKENKLYWQEKLGNLTILKKAMNIAVSNSNFNWKLNVYGDNSGGDFNMEDRGKPAGYKGSNLSINKNTVVTIEQVVKPREEWTAMSILRRGKYFELIAPHVWALPKIICTDGKCPGHSKSAQINIERGRMDYKEWLKGIDEKTCKEKQDNGQVCGKELVVLWPKNSTRAYQAPKTYWNCGINNCEIDHC